MPESHPCLVCGQSAEYSPPHPSNGTCACQSCGKTYFLTATAFDILRAREFNLTPEQHATLKAKVEKSKVFLGSDERPFRRLDLDAL
jgi:hypothetical protein